MQAFLLLRLSHANYTQGFLNLHPLRWTALQSKQISGKNMESNARSKVSVHHEKSVAGQPRQSIVSRHQYSQYSKLLEQTYSGKKERLEIMNLLILVDGIIMILLLLSISILRTNYSQR